MTQEQMPEQGIQQLSEIPLLTRLSAAQSAINDARNEADMWRLRYFDENAKLQELRATLAKEELDLDAPA